MNTEVRNNSAENRYEVWADGELAGYTQYVLRRGRIAFLHTEVYEAYEGMGLGSRLAQAALDDARARGLVVMPFCPFIAGFIERGAGGRGCASLPERRVALPAGGGTA